MMVTCSALRWKDDARLMTMRWLLGGLIILLTPGGAQARGQAHPARAEGWAEAQPLPAPRERSAVAVGRDGSIYVFGGDSSGKYYNTTFIYHPRANRWSTGAPMPTARNDARAVTLPDGRIIVLGGTASCTDNYACVALKTAEIYSPARDSWTTAAPLRTARYLFGAALSRNGRVYAIGGLSGNQVLSSVETYSPARNQWTEGPAALPTAAIGFPAVAIGAGAIVAVGGQNYGPYGPNDLNSMFIYNGVSWRRGAPLPTARFELGAAALPDGRIYTVGGVSVSGFMATVEAYNPLTDRWSSAVALPQPRCCLGVAALPSGDLYVIGGGSGAGISDQVLTLHIAASPGLVAAITPGDYRGVPLGSGQRLRSSDDGYPHEKEQWHA